MSKKKIAAKVSIKRADLKIVYKPTLSLKPDPRNAMTHSKDQIEALCGSMKEFGFTQPILLKPRDIIGAGHGRWEAAKLEEIDRVPTITLPGLTEQQWRAYAIADNQLARRGATWDSDILKSELEALAASDFDVTLLGFGDSALARLEIPGFSFGGGTNQESLTPTYQILIDCTTEKEQEELLGRLTAEGLRCKALLS